MVEELKSECEKEGQENVKLIGEVLEQIPEVKEIKEDVVEIVVEEPKTLEENKEILENSVQERGVLEEVQASSETVKEIEEEKEIENMRKIEAALFLSARFLNLGQLVMLTDVNPLMLKELLARLIEKYNTENSAIEIISKEDMWKMDVCKEYVGMINKLATGSSEFSKAEQETLAVIAYKQPVKQSVIIKIRGNKAYDHIKHFIDISLVQAKKMGHTKELSLSNDFFEYFHLQKKDGEMVIEESEMDDDSRDGEENIGDEDENLNNQNNSLERERGGEENNG